MEKGDCKSFVFSWRSVLGMVCSVSWVLFSHLVFGMLSTTRGDVRSPDIPWRVSGVLTRSSFVIYAVHLMILKLTSPFLNKLFGQSSVLCFFTLTFVAVCGGIVITVVMRMLSRRTLALLTGGRG